MSSLMSKVSKLIFVIFLVQLALMTSAYFIASNVINSNNEQKKYNSVATIEPHTLEEVALFYITNNEMALDTLLYDHVQVKDLSHSKFIPIDQYNHMFEKLTEFYKCRKNNNALFCTSEDNKYNTAFIPVHFEDKKIGYIHQKALLKKSVTNNFIEIGTILFLALLFATLVNIICIFIFFRHKVGLELKNIILLIENKLSNKDDSNNCSIKEFYTIENSIKKSRAKEFEKDAIKTRLLIEKEKNDISKQVAHDIKSPLSALDMIITDLDKIPEQKRLLIRKSVQRIQDITNNLTKNTRTVKNERELTLISSLIDDIVSEKRTTQRLKEGIDINIQYNSNSFGLFSNINPVELKRVISNVIDNAIYACSSNGVINISLTDQDDDLEICISNNGETIAPDIIDQIFNEGFTTKNENGLGLGLYHAKSALNELAGKISVKSGELTVFAIKIPKSKTPPWFNESITLAKSVVILDDDDSIHQIWHSILSNYDCTLTHYYNPGEFDTHQFSNDDLYLMDYELIGFKESGLDLIEKHKLANSTLVTSHYEDSSIQNRCINLGIKIIPKQLAYFSPIREAISTMVFIDDDELIRTAWSIKAKKKGINLLTFESIKDFINTENDLKSDIPIFVDSKLKDELGEVDSEKIFKLGFNNITLATGYNKEDINKPHWIKDIVGKRFPSEYLK